MPFSLPHPYVGGPLADALKLDDPQKFLKQLEDRMDSIQANFEELTTAFPANADGVGASPFPTTTLHTTTATTSGPTTTSGTYATLAQMTVTATFSGSPCIIFFTGNFSHSVAGQFIAIKPQLDGVDVTGTVIRAVDAPAVNYSFTLAGIWPVTPSQGSHTIDIKWATGAATATGHTDRRKLLILELRT